MSSRWHSLHATALICSVIGVGLAVLIGTHVKPAPYKSSERRPPAAETTVRFTAPTEQVSVNPGHAPPSAVGGGPAWLPIVLISAAVLCAGALLRAIAIAIAGRGQPRRRMGRRSSARSASPGHNPTVTPDVLAREIGAGLSDLDSGEVREAITACWIRLQAAARNFAVEPRASDAPEDLVVRLLKTWNVRPEPLEVLASLYREARFSTHRLSEDDRRLARSSLEQVRAELEASVHA